MIDYNEHRANVRNYLVGLTIDEIKTVIESAKADYETSRKVWDADKVKFMEEYYQEEMLEEVAEIIGMKEIVWDEENDCYSTDLRSFVAWNFQEIEEIYNQENSRKK